MDTRRRNWKEQPDHHHAYETVRRMSIITVMHMVWGGVGCARIQLTQGSLHALYYIVARAWRLYKTGFGLTIGFTGLNSITQLVITHYSSL
jgi:hypothetical protein